MYLYVNLTLLMKKDPITFSLKLKVYLNKTKPD